MVVKPQEIRTPLRDCETGKAALIRVIMERLKQINRAKCYARIRQASDEIVSLLPRYSPTRLVMVCLRWYSGKQLDAMRKLFTPEEMNQIIGIQLE